MSEPRMPSRTRLLRPDLYRDPVAGRLPPDARDLYLALTTVTDDAGWLLWRPEAIAAVLLPYSSPSRRVAILERRAGPLAAAGLIVFHECGCAELPRHVRDHAISGGNQTRAAADFHARNHGVQTSLDKSVSSSSSLSSSDSDSAPPATGSEEPAKTNGAKLPRPGESPSAFHARMATEATP